MSLIVALVLVWPSYAAPAPPPAPPRIEIPAVPKRPILVFCTSSACVHCPSVAKLLTPAPKGFRVITIKDNPGLFQALELSTLPTLILADPDGTELRRHVGRIERDALYRFLNGNK